MSLYTRLMGLEQPKIPVHQFMAALAERKAGQLNNNQLAALFSLSSAELQELSTLRDRVMAPVNALAPDTIHNVLMLAEQQLHYTTEAAVKARFGV